MVKKKTCCGEVARYAKKKDLFQTTLIEKSSFGAATSFILFPVLVICYIVLMFATVFQKTQTRTELVAGTECLNIPAKCISKYGCIVGEYKPENNETEEHINLLVRNTLSKDTIIKSYLHEETFHLNICPAINMFTDVAPFYGCSDIVSLPPGSGSLVNYKFSFKVDNKAYFYPETWYLDSYAVLEYDELIQKSRIVKLNISNSASPKAIISTYSTKKSSYIIVAALSENVKIWKRNIYNGKRIGKVITLSKKHCNSFDDSFSGYDVKYQLKNGTYIGILPCNILQRQLVTKTVLYRINLNGDSEPFIVDKGIVTEENRYCGFAQYNSSHGFLQAKDPIVNYLIDLNAWKIVSSSKRIDNGQCNSKSFFDCGRYMFLYQKETTGMSENYFLLAYDMLNNFHETISKEPFFGGIPSGGGCIITNQKVQATFVSKGTFQTDQFVTNVNIKEGALSVKSVLRLKGYYNEGGTTVLYKDYRDGSKHLLVELVKSYAHFAKVQILNINLNYALSEFPTAGKTLLKIGTEYNCSFPYPNDPSPTSSVFLSEIVNVAEQKKLEKLLYLDAKVLSYESLPCTIHNKSGQCKRINKHPASIKIVESFVYSTEAKITLIFTTIMSMYSALRIFVKYGLKCRHHVFGISNTVDKRSLSVRFLNGRFDDTNGSNASSSDILFDDTTINEKVEMSNFDSLRNRNSWVGYSSQDNNNM